ncbi:MAG: hypothetical protein GY850_02665 [bacterium]|nr:hypothetical protein [bacterium]
MSRKYLIVDEIPSLVQGIVDGDPPGRVLYQEENGTVLFSTESLKMPYDAALTPDGEWLINIIRERAVFRLSANGEMLGRIEVGGYPCGLQILVNGHLLVAGWDDDVAGFVREFEPSGKIVWRLEDLQWPWKAERLGNGNTLVADAGQCRVFEVLPNGSEVWEVCNLGPAEPRLFDHLGPVYVQRLKTGNTLVSVRGQSRIVEIGEQGDVVWEVKQPLVFKPYSAIRLDNGNTLIADQGHSRVIEIDSNSQIVWEKSGFGYPAKAYQL